MTPPVELSLFVPLAPVVCTSASSRRRLCACTCTVGVANPGRAGGSLSPKNECEVK